MSAAAHGVACALRTHHGQPLEGSRPTRIDVHACNTASTRHLQASVTHQRRQLAKPRALPGTLSCQRAGRPEATTNAQAKVAAVPPSRCATTACAGNANQLLADRRCRAQLQPLSKRSTEELRSWRARSVSLLERPASRGLLPQPPAGCQPSPRRPFCCHLGHQKFVSDDMSTGSTTPRPYDRGLIDRPSKVS